MLYEDKLSNIQVKAESESRPLPQIIALLSEEKLLYGPAAVEEVNDERPHYSTFYRWTEYGVLTPQGTRVRLEYLKCGKKRHTSVEAVLRFFAAQTEKPNSATLAVTPRQREAEISRASQELDLEGI